MQKFLARLQASKLTHALVAILTAVLAVGITIVVDQPGPTPGPGQATVPHKTITVTLGGPGKTRVALPPAAQAVAQSQALDQAAGSPAAAESNLHAEPPVATTPATIAKDQSVAPAGQPQIPKHLPAAAPSTPGCRTLLVRNYSSRAGSPTLLGVLHFTVSTDNGWNGVLGVVRWFDNPAAQASSNYVIDRRIGACALTVPEAAKAWAQAAYNRVALSVEVTANGTEGIYMPPGPGRNRLLYLMHRWHHVWHIPYQHGRVSNGSVLRAGFVQHGDLGAPGGGHHDIEPFGDKTVDFLIGLAAKTDPANHKVKPCSKRTACRMGRRHAAIHQDLRNLCGHAKTKPCRRLRARNDYIHRYAAKHHLVLVTK